jgi:hypothetical protein
LTSLTHEDVMTPAKTEHSAVAACEKHTDAEAAIKALQAAARRTRSN